MPSTKEATFQLIQQEISEVVQRERELKEKYASSFEEKPLTNGVNGTKEAKLEHQLPVTNGKISSRLFTPNPTTKGVMQRFIKSKGKLSKLSTTTTPTYTPTYTIDFVEPTTPVIPTGSSSRNGFVPINERIKREFLEMEKREVELRSVRCKSQSDLVALYDEADSPEFETRSLQPTRSISGMSDYDSLKDSSSSSLKAAKSLADLCDFNGEEPPTPGSLSLIKQWELLIQKNQVRP